MSEKWTIPAPFWVPMAGTVLLLIGGVTLNWQAHQVAYTEGTERILTFMPIFLSAGGVALLAVSTLGNLVLLLVASVRRAARWGLLMAGVVAVLVGFNMRPLVRPHAEGLAEWARTELDPTPIQSWVEQQETALADTNVPQEQWPLAIEKLDPRYVTGLADGSGVQIVWGGGFAHWGMTVRIDGRGDPCRAPGGFSLSRAYTIEVDAAVCVWSR